MRRSPATCRWCWRRQGDVKETRRSPSWVANERYAADDGINKVVVAYEPLRRSFDPFKAMAQIAPVAARYLAGKDQGIARSAQAQTNIFEWTVGDRI